ncbi:LysR family transcriptional regulator [Pseudodonghicola flavimaris]|uniref:LysR family transcriptional regulator n=1 Tax=Pseudodonghicola flavimaris TaxID=3050036 RepID=A0ABT7F309_9RHOB|nr:LysR family transcriptional regulator [Pseudodonghicola flavimaris]MDK3018839.1 LysR family transcriptional regulator [Pseudodonghicola flavimaris]
MPVSLRQLRAFRAVADAASFTGAAERLNLTQSAVSMLIRQFEEELKVPLFVRTGRGARLTEFGTQIRPTVMRVLSDLQNIDDSAADLRSLQRGHLRLAVPQMLGCCWLPPVLGRFRALYPDVEVTVLESAGDGVIEVVARGDAEIGIGPERPLINGVSAEFLWEVPMRLVVSAGSRLAVSGCRPALEDLEQSRWINYSDDFSEVLHRALLGTRSMPGAQDMRVLGLMSAMALIGTEDFVTVAPAYAGLFSGVFGLRFLSFDGPASRRRFLQYIRARHDLSPAAEAFLRLARDSAPTEPAGDGNID